MVVVAVDEDEPHAAIRLAAATTPTRSVPAGVTRDMRLVSIRRFTLTRLLLRGIPEPAVPDINS